MHRSSRVDRVAAVLGIPTEDLTRAMRSVPMGREGRVSTLSVRLGGTRTFRYSHKTSMDTVAETLGINSESLRNAMKEVARRERRTQGVWTMSVRVW